MKIEFDAETNMHHLVYEGEPGASFPTIDTFLTDEEVESLVELLLDYTQRYL